MAQFNSFRPLQKCKFDTDVDGAVTRVLQVGRNGEVDEVIDRVANSAELVNGIVPDERFLVPTVTLDDRPSAEFLQDLLERLQSQFFRSSCARHKRDTMKSRLAGSQMMFY